MDTQLRDRFTESWRRYFNQAELPLAFFYTDTPCAEPEAAIEGHRCLIGQLIKARNGRTLCMDNASVSCRGGKRYVGFSQGMFAGFAQFIARDQAGNGERYRRTPEQVTAYINTLPVLPLTGRYLVFKRWDTLTEADKPEGVLFLAKADVLAGLFTLAYYDSERSDAVIAPFGAGCMTTVYQTYREQCEGTHRAVIGMFDPSARKCLKADLISFGVPYGKFEEMIGQMDESFLATHSWEVIQRRI